MAGVTSYCLPVNSMITRGLLSGCDSIWHPKHSAFSFAWERWQKQRHAPHGAAAPQPILRAFEPVGETRASVTSRGTSDKSGGESGIRTHDTVSRIHAFQACAFSHSAISPGK